MDLQPVPSKLGKQLIGQKSKLHQEFPPLFPHRVLVVLQRQKTSNSWRRRHPLLLARVKGQTARDSTLTCSFAITSASSSSSGTGQTVWMKGRKVLL